MPNEITKLMLGRLPTKRMRNVMEKRFGLKGGHRFTLEAIGKEYKITRERVRQIEADALKRLSHIGGQEECVLMHGAFEDHIRKHGEVVSERELFSGLAEARHHPHINLLLGIGKQFEKINETDDYHSRWAISKEKVASVEKVMSRVIGNLEEGAHPVSRDELLEIVSKNIRAELNVLPTPEIVESYCVTSKRIGKNPYGEYGLVSWPLINPRGVKDRAYAVLAKQGKPMHFKGVAEAINKVGWTKKKAHPQTVHNELIKDSRFVLVGRGLYALKEWGFEEGPVRDVIVSCFKQAGHPLTKDEIVAGVLKKRFVKEPTILLNLQNRKCFKKTGEGKYALV